MTIATIILWLASILITPVYAKLDNQKLDLIKYATDQAIEYQMSPEKFVALLQCESSWEIGAKGDWSNEEKIFKANGVAQWWEKSFNSYSKKFNFTGEYQNPEDQIHLAAITIGSSKTAWQAWTRCGEKVGYK